MKKIELLEDKELLHTVTGGIAKPETKAPNLKQLINKIQGLVGKLLGRKF